MTKTPSIIIIGAGVSGIAAATKLIENGFENVTILEAENRIGGRVYSVDFGGSIVDLGGQWVHGEKGNLVYEKVKDLNLLTTSRNNFKDNTYYLSNGSIANKSITDRLFAIGSKIMDDRESCNSVAGTFGDYFIKRFQENVSKEFGNDNEIHKLGKSLETWFEKFFFCGHSESWFKISPSGAHVFESCEGDQQLNWKNQGYRTILDVLMKKIPNDTEQLDLDEKILLNKEVREIIWDDIASNDRVTVSCSDGSIYNADHVIMTTSVGVLKRFHESMFKPKLPAYKINSISNVGFGTVNKILLKFPTTWWPSDLKGINLLWTEKDKAKLINELSNFEPTENGRSWLEDIFGFYVIDSHPRVLLTFVVGDMAPKVEKVSDEMVTQGCMYLLRTFSGGIYEIPEPDEILRSKWSSNCHSCGSYAHVSIEAQKRKASAEDLAKPLLIENGKPVVLFAGEATHSTKFSTVNGAVETGYREAERLINMYK